jgi:hypothetical protein
MHVILVFVMEQRPSRIMYIRVIGRWWISRSGRHVIFYVSIFPFIVSVRVVATSIWVIYLFICLLSLCNRLGYERPTPSFLTDINIHSDTEAVSLKLSSLAGAPGQNPRGDIPKNRCPR